MTSTRELAASALTDLLFDATGAGRCLIAPDGTILRVNAEWLRATALHLDDVLGADYAGLFPDAQEVILAIHARARSGRAVGVPPHVRQIGGREQYLESTVEPVPLEAGVGLLVTTRRVPSREGEQLLLDSQRRTAELERTEAELRRMQSVLSQAGQMAHLGAWWIDVQDPEHLDESPLRWSDEVFRIFGYAPGEVEVTNALFFAHVHPDDRERIVGAVSDAMARKVPYALEHRVVRRDGAERIVLEHGETRWDAAGRPVLLVGAVQDITEQVRAREALRLSEERLRAHMANSPLAVIEFDAEFRITRWSEEAERMFGWTAGEVLGRAIGELRWVYEDDVEAVRAESERLRSGEGARSRNLNRNYRKDGSVIDCEWYSSALYDAQGRLVSTLSQVLDVTARRRAEEALRLSEERAREADRRKTDFLAVLSHELRNPLAPIRNGIELMERTPPGSPQHLHAREIVRRQTEHVTKLVDDLLDLSRITHGKITLDRARIDARDVVRLACGDVRGAFDERGVALRLDLPAEPLWMDADATRIAQVVGNLLANALKFTPARGAVDVSLRRAGERAELRVRDTGAGIDPLQLEEIFEQFAQADRTRGLARGGMGIGLSLVRTLVGLHGGAVHARSEGKGKGAELVVTLPLAAPPEPRTSSPGPGAPARRAILIVEDNPDAADTLAELLQLDGHRTRIARDGSSGVAAVEEWQPDVVVCDIGLPDVSGYDLIRRFRQLPAGRRVFAIALTGYAQPDDVRRAIEAGFDAHLPKPPALGELEALIEAAPTPAR